MKEIKQLSEELKQGDQPKDARLDNQVKIDLCANLGNDVNLAIRIYLVVSTYAGPGWRVNEGFQKVLRRELKKALAETPYDVEAIFRICFDHTEDFN